MDAQKIEKLDRQRYNAWLVQLIGTALWGGVVIYEKITGGDSTALDIAMAAGLAFFLAGTVLKKIVQTKMRNDGKMNRALNNELYKLYNYKTYVWGFYAAMVSMIVLTFVVRLVNAESVCLISIFVSAITAVTARLVYYRNSHE